MTKARDLANAGTALTSVSATELGYVDGVTSAIQTQIDSKIGQATAINPTIVDAKGDIIAATAADTVARLAVGANDTVLTADSSTATGLKWAAAAVSSLANTQTFTSSTTFTVPSGVKTIIAYLLGGGGGGGSGAGVDSSTASSGGCGGNGGAFGYQVIAVTPGESITVTVGAGGSGGAGLSLATGSGASNGNTGNDGGTTSFKNASVLGGKGGTSGVFSGTANAQTVSDSLDCIVVRNGPKSADCAANGNGGTGNAGLNVFPGLTATTGTAGTTAPAGTLKGTGGGVGTAGFAGSGGGGGGGTLTSARNGGTATYGSGGGGGAAATNGAGTTTAGAGGAGAANTGAGGGGGGACFTANATISSGAGGNGGSGAITIFY